ncbi:MAG: hypothetical protein WDO73_21870 [Ignavibacteriota bacterium]
MAQDGTGGVVIETTQATEALPGDLVDAVGFPAPGRYVPVLQDGDFRKIGKGTLPAPIEIHDSETSVHDAELVRISGLLLDQAPHGDDLRSHNAARQPHFRGSDSAARCDRQDPFAA